METNKLQADPACVGDPSRGGGTPAGAEPAARRAAVDVVAVSADMAEMTLACISALPEAGAVNTVVVDNGFDDAAGAERQAIAARASVVRLGSPHGFAAANNRGVAVGEAPFVLFLNSDVLAVSGAVEALLDALREDPGAVAAGGRLVDPQTLVTQPEYRPRPFPSLANFLVILSGLEELWPGNPLTSRYHGAQVDDSTTQAVAQPAAAALMVRRDELEAVGGFDERFWFWFEDADLLKRLAERGRVLYVPGAVFRHLGGGSFRRWTKVERIRSVHHGMLQYASVHFPPPARALLGLATVAVSLPRIILFRRSRPAECRAWRDVLVAGLALSSGRPVPAIAP
jgi:N-acetylglucosaminyl-diphospho-decaprenol L-rhamnosyltransferase